MQCHICGKWWVFLASHIWQTHDILAYDYRALFGLGYCTSLMGEDLRRHKSIFMKEENRLRPREGWGHRPFSPQDRAKVRGRPKREEQRRKNLVSHPVRWIEHRCIICGKRFVRAFRVLGNRLTCSDACLAKRKRQIMLGDSRGKDCWSRASEQERKAWLVALKARAKKRRKIITKACVVCGSLYQGRPYEVNRKTCSRECFIELLKRTAARPRRSRVAHIKTCQNCGKGFGTKANNARWCSDCRHAKTLEYYRKYDIKRDRIKGN